MPTLEDLIHTLNGATAFSKLDLRVGYHQLSPASVHYDIRKAQLTNSASEIFQKIIQDQFRNVPGTLNISDNVIVFDKTQTGHDAALDAACRRFADVGLTL